MSDLFRLIKCVRKIEVSLIFIGQVNYISVRVFFLIIIYNIYFL